MANYNLNDRPMPGGSMVPRLNPRISETGLNQKLGPRLPSPLANSMSESKAGQRRRAIGLPERFNKD